MMKKLIYVFIILVSFSLFHNYIFAYHEDDLKKIQNGCLVLTSARLNDAPLQDCIFHFAYFPYSSFNGANLKGSFLVSAVLNNSDFESANLEDTNLTGAFFNRSVLLNANLKNAKVKDTSFFGAYGLSNDQKKHLRKNGAISVPNDLTEQEFKQELKIMEIMIGIWAPEKKKKITF